MRVEKLPSNIKIPAPGVWTSTQEKKHWHKIELVPLEDREEEVDEDNVYDWHETGYSYYTGYRMEDILILKDTLPRASSGHDYAGSFHRRRRYDYLLESVKSFV
jgi:hypothetical protein